MQAPVLLRRWGGGGGFCVAPAEQSGLLSSGYFLLPHPVLYVSQTVEDLGPNLQTLRSIGEVGCKELLANAHVLRRRAAVHVVRLGNLPCLVDGGKGIGGGQNQWCSE